MGSIPGLKMSLKSVHHLLWCHSSRDEAALGGQHPRPEDEPEEYTSLAESSTQGDTCNRMVMKCLFMIVKCVDQGASSGS